MNSDLENEIKRVLSKTLGETETEDILSRTDLACFSRIIDAINKEDSLVLRNELENYSCVHREVYSKREQHDRLGGLARQFQKSLFNFRDSLGARVKSEEHFAGDAQAQIESVIKMTNDAAMSVLELGEKQMESCKTLLSEANTLKSSLSFQNTNSELNQMFLKLTDHIELLSKEMDECNHKLLLTQSYQDISGQILLRLKSFISSVESGLIEMVKMLASDVVEDSLTEIDKVKILNNCDQNDVDDLLASLGF